MLEIFQKWKALDQLNIRIFCIDGIAGGTPEQVDRALVQIPRMKLFQGDIYIDNIFFGEGLPAVLRRAAALTKGSRASLAAACGHNPTPAFAS